MEGPTKLIIAVAVLTLGIFGIILATDKDKNATGEEPLGVKYDDQGQEHISVGAGHPSYNSNPPTSGWHYAEPAEWGSYDVELPDEQLIHNLEHGGVNIFYKPGAVDQVSVDQLKTIQREFANKTIVAPRSANNKAIALTSWNYLLELDAFDGTAIRDFIRRNKNKAPEFFPD